METNICKNCKHFRQHYVKFGRGYSETNFGHCVHPRIKSRVGSTPSCPHFNERKAKGES